MDKAGCIETSGSSIHLNQGGCCGTQRGSVKFPPCNSQARRCIKCLELGRRGGKANAVDDPDTGRCVEHALNGAGDSHNATSLMAQQRAARLAAAALQEVTTSPRNPGGPGLQKTQSAPSPVVTKEPAAAKPPAYTPPVVRPAPLPTTTHKPVLAPSVAKPHPQAPVVASEALIAAGLAGVKKLNERELKLFTFSIEGATNADLARHIKSTEGAVGVAMVSVFKKLGLGQVQKRQKRAILVQIRARYMETKSAAAVESPTKTEPRRVTHGKFVGLDAKQINAYIDEAEAALRSIGATRQESRND